LSPDRVVVLAGILFGAAFFGPLAREPAAVSAARFDFGAPRRAPLSTSLGPGLSGFCRALPLRCAPALLGAFSFPSFLRNARLELVLVSGGLTRLTRLFMTFSHFLNCARSASIALQPGFNRRRSLQD
jgi:hypothetical protein